MRVVHGQPVRHARPTVMGQHAESLVAQARKLGVAPFVKQLGTNSRVDGTHYRTRHNHGGHIGEFPHALRVREWPARYRIEAAE